MTVCFDGSINVRCRKVVRPRPELNFSESGRTMPMDYAITRHGLQQSHVQTSGYSCKSIENPWRPFLLPLEGFFIDELVIVADIQACHSKRKPSCFVAITEEDTIVLNARWRGLGILSVWAVYGAVEEDLFLEHEAIMMWHRCWSAEGFNFAFKFLDALPFYASGAVDIFWCQVPSLALASAPRVRLVFAVPAPLVALVPIQGRRFRNSTYMRMYQGNLNLKLEEGLLHLSWALGEEVPELVRMINNKKRGMCLKRCSSYDLYGEDWSTEGPFLYGDEVGPGEIYFGIEYCVSRDTFTLSAYTRFTFVSGPIIFLNTSPIGTEFNNFARTLNRFRKEDLTILADETLGEPVSHHQQKQGIIEPQAINLRFYQTFDRWYNVVYNTFAGKTAVKMLKAYGEFGTWDSLRLALWVDGYYG